MTIFCPHPGCGLEMWDYDSRLYTCKNGHKMAKTDVQPATPRTVAATHVVVPRPSWWQSPVIPWAVAGVLAVGQILEVLL